MPRAERLPNFPPGSGFDPERELLAFAEQTVRIVAVAQALVASRRTVDVVGLQQQIGLLCAKALDLPPNQTGFARIELQRLATGLAALQSAMRQNAA